MHTVFALLCFVVVIHWLIFPYQSGLLHWHCGNLTIAPVPAKQPWWIWINTSCEFIMKDCITTTKQSTTKPCAYFLGYTVYYPGAIAEVGISRGWVTAMSSCHPDDIRSKSWSHPNEIANFDFSQHFVALRGRRHCVICVSEATYTHMIQIRSLRYPIFIHSCVVHCRIWFSWQT